MKRILPLILCFVSLALASCATSNEIMPGVPKDYPGAVAALKSQGWTVVDSNPSLLVVKKTPSAGSGTQINGLREGESVMQIGFRNGIHNGSMNISTSYRR